MKIKRTLPSISSIHHHHLLHNFSSHNQPANNQNKIGKQTSRTKSPSPKKPIFESTSKIINR